MKRVCSVLLFLGVLLLPRLTYAQVANPTALTFESTDHTATIPAGAVNAGQPAIASYQAMLFPAAADPASGVPTIVGPVIAKTLATTVASTTPQRYRLTFAQMGITTPACSTLPCPQYSMLLVAIGPNGTSARGVAGESDLFTAAVPTPGSPPAGPTSVRVGP